MSPAVCEPLPQPEAGPAHTTGWPLGAMRQDQCVSQPAGEASPNEPLSWRGSVRRGIRARPGDVVDLFVYVVVLNLAIEYLPSVISESFTLSLLTAALLKVSLELVIVVKNKILVRFRNATSRVSRVIAALALWAVAAGSKFLVLELVNLVFGDSVSLGGFIPVTLLVVALMVSRAAVRRLLDDTPPAG